MILYIHILKKSFKELKFIMKIKKKWLIIIGAIVVCLVAFVWFYKKNVPVVFTKAEYIKEVVIQNQSFNDVLDKFLDEVTRYDGSKEDTEKLEATANKLSNFVKELDNQLGPKVPESSKEHYQKMMDAYNMYIEGVDMYKKAVPKNLGDERNTQISQARDKIAEAKSAMKNLK